MRVDTLLPELLVFPPGSDLHDHPLVESGALILQSKASCMPARALAPRPGWRVLDACAAPGNKTTHVAALVAQTKTKKGSVVAFDKDRVRLQRLQANADCAGAGALVDARCADFLALEPSAPEFANIDAVLLDPSCSGSGTSFSRMDHLLPSAASRATGEAAVAHTDPRVEALAAFQTAALMQALRFPGARRVVYSTCSLHAVENEGVVAAALPEAARAGFRLVAALPDWPRRGLALEGGLSAKDAAKLVRTGEPRKGREL